MTKDILGKQEFDSLKLNLETIDDGRCLATGTCNHLPMHLKINRSTDLKIITFQKDLRNAQDIKTQYGCLRS